MAVPEITPAEEGGDRKRLSMKEIMAGAPDGALEAMMAMREIQLEQGETPDFDIPDDVVKEFEEAQAAKARSNDQAPPQGDGDTGKVTVGEVISEKAGEIKGNIMDQLNKLKGNKKDGGEQSALEEDTAAMVDRENASPDAEEVATEVISPDGTVVKLDAEGHPINQKHGRIQNLTFNLMQGKQMMFELIKGSPETREMVQAVLQEKFEHEYLITASRNDRIRMEALARQVGDINMGLQTVTGKNITLLGLYESDPNNAPITTTEGLFGFMKFHIEVAKNILPASQIAGESADIYAKLQLIPIRQELQMAIMSAQAEKAQKYIEIAPDLREAARLRGQVMGEQFQSFLVPILTSVPAAAFEVPKAVAERYVKWFDDSEDKMVPISVVVGSTGTTYILVTTAATLLGGPLVAIGIGLVGGGVLGVAGWKAVQIGGTAIMTKAGEWSDSAKKWVEEKLAQKKGKGGGQSNFNNKGGNK